MQIVTVVQVYVLYTVLCTLFGNSVQKDVAMTLKVRSCRPESFWGSDFCSIYIFFYWWNLSDLKKFLIVQIWIYGMDISNFCHTASGRYFLHEKYLGLVQSMDDKHFLQHLARKIFPFPVLLLGCSCL